MDTAAPRRPDLEKQLDRLVPGEWTYDPAVPLSFIDQAGSLQRRAGGPREPDELDVARFAAEMERGAVFPAIICAGRRRVGELLIVDGLRIYLAALKAGWQHIPVYRVPDVQVGERR